MGARIRTILLVTIVTLLIWVWAEGESLTTQTLNPRISFVGPTPTGSPGDEAPELIVRPTTEAWRGTVRIRLEGSTIAIKAAEDALAQPVKLRPGQPGVPSDAGETKIVDLTDALRSYPALTQTGVTVVDADP